MDLFLKFNVLSNASHEIFKIHIKIYSQSLSSTSIRLHIKFMVYTQFVIFINYEMNECEAIFFQQIEAKNFRIWKNYYTHS